MKTIQVTREIYRYGELSEGAKITLRDEYIDDHAHNVFHSMRNSHWISRLAELGYPDAEFWSAQDEPTSFSSNVDLEVIAKRMKLPLETQNLVKQLADNWWEGEVIGATKMFFAWVSSNALDAADELGVPAKTLDDLDRLIVNWIQADLAIQASAISAWSDDLWGSINSTAVIDDILEGQKKWYFADGEECDEYEEDDDAIDA